MRRIALIRSAGRRELSSRATVGNRLVWREAWIRWSRRRAEVIEHANLFLLRGATSARGGADAHSSAATPRTLGRPAARPMASRCHLSFAGSGSPPVLKPRQRGASASGATQADENKILVVASITRSDDNVSSARLCSSPIASARPDARPRFSTPTRRRGGRKAKSARVTDERSRGASPMPNGQFSLFTSTRLTDPLGTHCEAPIPAAGDGLEGCINKPTDAGRLATTPLRVRSTVRAAAAATARRVRRSRFGPGETPDKTRAR